MHAHPGHPHRGRHLGDRGPAVNTARTASRRCSTFDKTTRAIPGLLSTTMPTSIALRTGPITARC